MADTVDFTIDEVNALIARVEYALEHDLSVSSDDLKQLLELLLGFNARLNRQKSTIDKLRKLSGLVSQAEAGPRDSNGKPKRPPRRVSVTISPALQKVRHQRLSTTLKSTHWNRH